MPRCYLGLGGNVGPVEQTLQRVYQRLRSDDIRLIATSRILTTTAVGKDAGTAFRNAAAAIETRLPPLDLLKRLNQIEADLGRERVIHWGPRTIDIDLLLYGDQTIDVEGLTVPHPACWYRSFVLTPLAEIAADVVHPVKQVTIGRLHEGFRVRPLPIAVAGDEIEICRDLVSHLCRIFSDKIAVSSWHPETRLRISESAMVLWCGSDQQRFDELPRVSRLDLTGGQSDIHESAVYAIQSAVG
jgi:2-amino-4-hydroxy-6-hydroxymethyldihydropteridine diphosphokinase